MTHSPILVQNCEALPLGIFRSHNTAMREGTLVVCNTVVIPHKAQSLRNEKFTTVGSVAMHFPHKTICFISCPPVDILKLNVQSTAPGKPYWGKR